MYDGTNMCGSPVWTLIRVTSRPHRILIWLSNLDNIFITLSYAVGEICVKVKVKVKVRFTPEQATKAQRGGGRGIALLLL